MEYDSFAFGKIKENPKEWLILGLVMMLLSSIPLLSFVVIMNAQRAIIRYLEGKGEIPTINDLLNTDHATDFIIGGLLAGIAISSGIMLCFIGIYATIVLFFFGQYLIADGLFSPVDGLKASFYYAKDNIGPIIIFILIESILMTIWGTLALLTCGLGYLVLMPMLNIVMCKFYIEHKEGILAAAQKNAVPLLVKK